MSDCLKPRPSAHRKRRGAETQRIVAEALRRDGWPFAEATGAGLQGVDITGTPGLAFEVKARRDFDPKAAMRQAIAHASGVPIVVVRPDGMGPTTVDDWPAILPFHVLRRLLRMAGYGEPIEEGE